LKRRVNAEKELADAACCGSAVDPHCASAQPLLMNAMITTMFALAAMLPSTKTNISLIESSIHEKES